MVSSCESYTAQRERELREKDILKNINVFIIFTTNTNSSLFLCHLFRFHQPFGSPTTPPLTQKTSTFRMPLASVMKEQQSTHPHLDFPYVLKILGDCVINNGGLTTVGIFRYIHTHSLTLTHLTHHTITITVIELLFFLISSYKIPRYSAQADDLADAKLELEKGNFDKPLSDPIIAAALIKIWLKVCECENE